VVDDNAELGLPEVTRLLVAAAETVTRVTADARKGLR